MEHYVGLDVSLKLTAICIVDRTGKIEREGVVPSDPEAIAIFIELPAPHVARVGLETGATATWLWTELNKLGLPVVCNRCQACQGSPEDADQQKRSQRHGGHRPDCAMRMVQGGPRQKTSTVML